MSFLTSNSEYLAARLTSKGRQKISEGNFVISYFQIGDSEFDYNFSQLDGNTNPGQKVFTPLDKDGWVKYPYKLSASTTTGTTYGTPVVNSGVVTINNEIGPAGFVSAYLPYTPSPLTGATIVCENYEIDIAQLSGSTSIQVPTGVTFNGSEYITIYLGTLVGTSDIISTTKNSLVYKIVDVTTGVTYNTITLDRNTPILTGLTGSVTVISNYCDPNYTEPGISINCIPTPIDVDEQQDPWTLNIVWSQKPAGLDVFAETDEELSGYTSNIHTSTKEFLGYNISDGQVINTGTTIVNNCGETIIVPPEEQHSLAIIHYEGVGDYRDPDKYFKYEDYISHTGDSIDYFEIYIPFILYHRNTGTTIGARFFMDSTDYYINSTAADTKTDRFKFRYLIDEQASRVGRILVNNKTIVIDDQEIIAALDYKSNRRYTLPIPNANLIPLGSSCTPGVIAGLDISTGDTIYVSYLFEYTGNTAMNGMHCNYYSKIEGSNSPSNIIVSFCSSGFTHMYNTLDDFKNGFVADKFKILIQIVPTGTQPQPNLWYVMDYTDEIPNHTVGSLIDPTNMEGASFIITQDKVDIADIYDLEEYIGELPIEPSDLPEFGDEQPFPGSIKLVRASDIYTMSYLVNLPTGQFETTQNPTWVDQSKKITEVALMNSNKEILVIAKAATPITRTGSQVIQVNLDF